MRNGKRTHTFVKDGTQITLVPEKAPTSYQKVSLISLSQACFEDPVHVLHGIPSLFTMGSGTRHFSPFWKTF